MERIPMTAEGYKSLEHEVNELKTVERPAIIRMISEARAHGDLSENAEYHAAKERQAFIEGRVIELEDLIGRADVIDVSRLSGASVKFGATVTSSTKTPTKSANTRSSATTKPTPPGPHLDLVPISRADWQDKGDTVEVAAPAARARTRS
jgi:transcription elongation factor GreA